MDPDDLEDDLPLADELDDQSLDQDDGGDADDGDDALALDPAGDAPAAKPLSRAQRAVLAAKRTASQAREETAQLRRDLDALRNNSNRTSQAELDRQEREAYALMSGDERVEFNRTKDAQARQQLEQRGNLMYADLADQRAYDRKCATDPRYLKLADKVEEELAKERAKGNNPGRVTLFKILYADQILSKAPKAAAKQRAAGQQRIADQRARAPGGGSGGAGSARQTAAARLSDREARRKRLEGVTF